MRFKSAVFTIALAAVILSTASSKGLQAKDNLSEEEALKLGTDAYIFGYSLVSQDLYLRRLTNMPAPEGLRAPIGQFAHARQFLTAEYRDVKGPNVDTLYSSAWLDLAKEPYVLGIPDAQGRYFVMPMFDGWGNVFQAPGSRTTGTKAQTFAIAGPNWKGELPKNFTEIKSPADIVWILVRTYCTGTPEDYNAAHAFQDKLSLVPLSAYGKDYTPPKGRVDPSIDAKMPEAEQVASMGAAAFFKQLAAAHEGQPAAKSRRARGRRDGKHWPRPRPGL
jgi:hypothetical protein